MIRWLNPGFAVGLVLAAVHLGCVNESGQIWQDPIGDENDGVKGSDEVLPEEGGRYSTNGGTLPIRNLVDHPKQTSALIELQGSITSTENGCTTEEISIDNLTFSGGLSDAIELLIYRVVPILDGSGDVSVIPAGVGSQQPAGGPILRGTGYYQDCTGGQWITHPSSWLLVVGTSSGETIDIESVYKCITANTTDFIGQPDVNISYVTVSASCGG